ncbi:MAG: restriction endonuclease subunit S [Bacteroidales bacterium]|nr:restriction endonuclease subunit S [Bacteroidales bacterium]
MRSNYRPLSEFIREIKERNLDGSITTLLGINIDKYFMPSVANVVGTDLSVYKVVKKGQFACNRMHVGRDKRLPVALSKSVKDFIVSPAYDVFEIIDESVLNPEYLMMWFSRKEFDRNAWFYTDADIRGGLSWSAFCDMQIPVPSIEKQKRIMDEYNTIVNRIKINEQLNKKLEETAQAIYKQWFVDFEFPDENGNPYKSSGGEMEHNSDLNMVIPKGWGVKPFTEAVSLNGGGTPSTDVPKYWGGNIPFFTPADVTGSYYSICTQKSITEDGLKNCSSKIYPKDTVFVTARGTVGAIAVAGQEMAMNQSCYACLGINGENQYYIHQLTIDTIKTLKAEALGAVFNALVTRDFEGRDVIIPPKHIIEKYGLLIQNMYVLMLNYQKQIRKSQCLAELLLAQMTTFNN